ncbi:MAG: hypothetical protein VX000_02975, partial [Myxococcota bacterium]|nr:hypothetical protein [Myxococcota bacterium]
PSAHGVATDVAETHGMALALEAGWRPDGAALPPEARIEAAAWLHGRGRGGEGRRLLHAGRGDARVAWWWTLAVRMEGLPSPEARHLQAPPEAFRLPGGFSVGETLLTDGLREWLVDVESECALALTAWGDTWNGPPRLSLSIDGSALPMWALPLQPAARSLGRLAPGPHRVTARFDNDAAGSDGDRNVHLLGFSCAND